MRPSKYACFDRMCGAEDCATCHPEWQGEDADYHAPKDEDEAREETKP